MLSSQVAALSAMVVCRFAQQEMSTCCSILAHGHVSEEASEVYGSGMLLFRIGNGGAGATGLLKVLCNAYLAATGKPGSIEWVCNHSRNTQVALYRNAIDLSLTYERDFEDLAAKEGWCQNHGPVFHDQFCLVGPAHDPANAKSARDIYEALDRIALTKSLFHSRVDGSATMVKERQLWSETQHTPWLDGAHSSSWYHQSLLGPADALVRADAAQAYLLSDRSTLLSQTGKQRLAGSRVYFEPGGIPDVLMNTCCAATSTTSSLYRKEAQMFLEWLLGQQAQHVVAEFGVKDVGAQLFAPVKQGIATPRLKRGRPVSHRRVSSRL